MGTTKHRTEPVYKISRMIKKKKELTDAKLNASWEGVDKAPGEEEGIKEKVTMTDLKGKKVDGDPEKESDQPVKQQIDKEKE
jgi:hypothetical protein